MKPTPVPHSPISDIAPDPVQSSFHCYQKLLLLEKMHTNLQETEKVLLALQEIIPGEEILFHSKELRATKDTIGLLRHKLQQIWMELNTALPSQTEKLRQLGQQIKTTALSIDRFQKMYSRLSGEWDSFLALHLHMAQAA